MADDPKALVATGYDAIAEIYLEQFGHSKVRDRWLGELVALLPKHARVLDLGCGSGLPVARELVARGFNVVGVDGSARQIEMARNTVAGAEFIQADMRKVEFAQATFDAVAAFYSITHVPRAEHPVLLQQIATWLKPSGVFLASLGSRSLHDRREEWLGTQMFFSHYGADENMALLRAAGFIVIGLRWWLRTMKMPVSCGSSRDAPNSSPTRYSVTPLLWRCPARPDRRHRPG
jgi:SAM-dependent methyltransferase